jgi:hypothetical protein
MAKQTGLGDNLYVAGYNLSGDIGSIDDIGGGNEPLGVTGIDKSGMERLGGPRSGRINMASWFNDAVAQEHPVFSPLPTADVIVSYFRGTTIGNAAASLVAKQINYDGSRGDDGAFTFKVEAQSNAYGLEWGEQLTAGADATLTAAGALTSYDYGAAVGTTAFGLQAYLHVFAFTGTSATVAIQSSTDNGAGDAFADITGAVFTAATGRTSERIATATNASVERYLRVNVTGTFSALTFAVQVTRNGATPTF